MVKGDSEDMSPFDTVHSVRYNSITII